MEEMNLWSEVRPHRFDPLPLDMRPGAPDNIGSMSTNDKRDTRVDVKRQSMQEERNSQSGRVMIGYQRSATLSLGSVCCWVDGDRDDGKVLDGWWDIQERNMGM